jgi:uncharacterized FlaG/YvyC family protein
MDITPVQRSIQELPTVAPVHGPGQPAENREVIQAVKAINGAAMLGLDNELMFHRDRQTQRMVIRLVNRKTGDVISQSPPEYVLRLAAQLKEDRKVSL